ncbi:hypothetical protein MSAS_02350 [Mycobacterium saskatchewanense]|uniref:DUF5666 domain-containing protein n=1 Tax=Mycobacterium saskatchewanense TaxID=220927 RepID=A0AAJ3NMZ8_9MYCO|nr:hypothetical protein [Mycobacterium saskatchewanense]ORW69612.1 hypothetical protein AWC23_01640 [Mycobacterium saskatchewanense]BBX61061.1 hypothetical protein MSAS_02350 [Mycobacterium saskatchewanense]
MREAAGPLSPRLLRFAGAALVIALVALGLTMCGRSNDTASNTGKPTVSAIPPAPSAAPPGPPPPPTAKDYVEGMVQSVSGDTIALRTRTGSATVDFTPTTPVFQVTAAQRSDVTAGSCVNVRATPQSAPGAGITAQAVTIAPAVGGKCPPPAGFYGTVASVAGNTFEVSGIGTGGPTSVTVADSTSYQKQTVSNAQAIANGTCMGAQGTDDAGALRAVTISLQQCPPMGAPHHHLHIPHLPHLHL